MLPYNFYVTVGKYRQPRYIGSPVAQEMLLDIEEGSGDSALLGDEIALMLDDHFDGCFKFADCGRCES